MYLMYTQPLSNYQAYEIKPTRITNLPSQETERSTNTSTTTSTDGKLSGGVDGSGGLGYICAAPVHLKSADAMHDILRSTPLLYATHFRVPPVDDEPGAICVAQLIRKIFPWLLVTDSPDRLIACDDSLVILGPRV